MKEKNIFVIIIGIIILAILAGSFVLALESNLQASVVVLGDELPDESLVLYYKFEGNSIDSSDYGNDGTGFGVSYEAGHDGLAASFDGVNDYINAGSDLSLDNIQELSFMAWVKLNSFGEGNYGRILWKNEIELMTTDQSSPRDRVLQFNNQGFFPKRGVWNTPDYSLNTGEWIHIALTYDSGSVLNNPKMYINGNPVLVNEYEYPFGVPFDNDGSYDLLIGNRPSLDRSYHGIIDELKIYNRILDDSEIYEEYSGEPEPTCEIDLNCGIDGFLGNEFCGLDENIYDTFREFSCNLPGTLESFCSSSDTLQLIETCNYGCDAGACLPEPECIIDLDCGNETYSQEYCSGNSVVRDHITPTCTSGFCGEESVVEIVEVCGSGFTCELGACVESPEDESLVSWYKFEGDVLDKQGNNNGINRGVNFDSGQDGLSASFSGFNYVQIPDSSLNNIIDEVSVSGWIYITSNYRDQKIISTQNNIAGGFKLGVYANNKLEFEIRDSSNRYSLNRWIPGGTVLQKNQWYHVAGVYNKTGNYIKTYIDGNLDRALYGVNVLAQTTGDDTIGREAFKSSNYFFGKIDELKIWSESLSDSEIYEEYSGEPEPTCEIDLNCGIDGFLGNEFCGLDENIYDTFREFSCNLPGTLESFCSSSDTLQLVETCNYGCDAETCLPEPECIIDLDCGNETYSQEYCSGNSVVRDHITPTCTSGFCGEESVVEIVEVCGSGFTCELGACVESPEDESLVLYYKFEGNSIDSSDYGNDGTGFGISYEAGHEGLAASFDGVNDYINAGSDSSLDNIQELSFMAWIKLNSFGEGNYGRILWKNEIELMTTDQSSPRDRVLQFNNQGFFPKRGVWNTEDGTLNTGEWIHIALTYDSGSVLNNPKMYINGVLVDVNEYEYPFGVPFDSDGSYDLLIGNRPSLDRSYHGVIDELKIYNRILDDSEIYSEYLE